MNKIKTWKVVSSILLILNVTLVVFIFIIDKPRGMPQSRLGESIKATFNFDEEQMAQFESSKQDHKAKARPLTKKLNETSLIFYKSIDNEKKRKIKLEIEQLTDKIYQLNDRHFEDIRSICREEQLKDMDRFIDRLIQRQEPRIRNGKGPKRRK